MKSVLGFLLLLFAAPSYGLESVCDATQGASVCYGALGGPVMLQLMRNTTGHELRLSKGYIPYMVRAGTERPYSQLDLQSEKNVFSIRGGIVGHSSRFPQGRWEVVAGNGTLIINPAERSDSGTYTVWIYREYRTLVGYHTIQLVIEAPVSDLDLSISCPANGERRVNCSSNGDRPEYSWSLDGRALSGADADLSADNQNVLLKGNMIGQLTCTVSNHVSTASITKTTHCPVPVSDLDLSIGCLANGKKMMWCSSNGDSPEYSWSLDGRALSGADADLSADNQTVLLKGNVIGQLTCTVSNHVSTANITKPAICPGISPVFISVWLAEIIVFASLLVGGCYLQMRGKRTHTAGENQEVELSAASMSRSRRRRRGLEEGEGPSGDNRRESVTYENAAGPASE